MRGMLMALVLGGVWLAGASALTLDEALREALARHPGLKAGELKAQVLRRDRESSFQAWYPTVTAGVGVQRWNDTGNHRRLTGLTPVFSGSSLVGLNPSVYEPDPVSTGAQLDLRFTFGLGAVSSVLLAEAQWEAGEADLRGLRAAVVAGVRKAYAGCLALSAAVSLASRQESTARDRWVFVEAGRAQGTQGEAESLQAKALWTERSIERLQMEARLAEARSSLAVLLGRPQDDFDLEGEILPWSAPGNLSAAALSDRFLSRRPDLAALDAQGRVIDAQVWGAAALAVPQVVVGWKADPGTNGGSPWTQTQGALSVEFQWKLDSLLPWSRFWTLKDDLADYQAGLTQTKIQTARAARAEVERLVRVVNDSRIILPLRETQAADAARAAALSQLAFRAGVKRIIEAQEADDQAGRAQLGLLEARLQLLSAQADLELALSVQQEELYAQ